MNSSLVITSYQSVQDLKVSVRNHLVYYHLLFLLLLVVVAQLS